MKKFLTAVIVGLMFSFFFSSCCKCDPRTDDALEFKLVNANGNDLYSGTNATYKIDSLKIFYRSSVGILVQEQTSAAKSSSADSSIFVSFHTSDKKPLYYFFYTYNTFDSVNIEWKRVQAKCCGEPFSYDKITSVKFKNALVLPDSKGIYNFIR